MHVERLRLENFRCYRQLDLSLPAGPVVVCGGNAQGKTSLLEALYVLATTKAPQGAADRDLIHWAADDEPQPFCRVRGQVVRRGETVTIEVQSVGRDDGRDGVRYSKRTLVNGVSRRALDVIGHLNVVLFTPRDMRLVDGPPAERRRYLDVLLCQIDGAYCRALGAYNRVLVQRNNVLRHLRDQMGQRDELAYWDEALARHGALLVNRRLAAVAALDEEARNAHSRIAVGESRLQARYHSRVAEAAAENGAAGTGPLDPAATSAAHMSVAHIAATFARELEARHDAEVHRGLSLFGPHRDDLCLFLGHVDVRRFGSRGQQRTVTLALKLAESAYMRRETGEQPVLLLDDVLSELDPSRREHLLGQIAADQQSVITTADDSALHGPFMEQALRLRVRNAEVWAMEAPLDA